MPAIGDLLRDTRVSEDPTRSTDKQRRYQATIPDSWNILYAFGGVTMATAVNAARTALSQPSFDLLSATATFVAPIQAGPATIDVRTLRSGKGSEQMVVDLRSGEGDHSDLHVAVTFGPKRESDTRFADPPVPIVKKPDDTHPPPPPADYPMLKLPYHQSVEIKSCGDRMPWDTSWEGDKARWVGWFRFANTPRLADGTLDPIAYIPPCDMIGPALLQARGPKAAPTMVVSLEISVHFLQKTSSEWLLQDTQCYHAGDGYASGMVHLWDEQGTLVAHAIQRAVMRARFF